MASQLFLCLNIRANDECKCPTFFFMLKTVKDYILHIKQIHSNKAHGWGNTYVKIIQIYQRHIMAYKKYVYISLVGHLPI